MLNLLKMDLRRLIRSKSLYLTIILFSLLSIYTVYSQSRWQITNQCPMPEMLQIEFGIYSAVDVYLNNVLQFMYIFFMKNGIIFFSIFLVSFIANDDQSGFIKNTCMMCNKRRYILFVKGIISVIISISIIIISFLLASIAGYLFISDFTIGSIKEIIALSCTLVFFYTGFFSMVMFLYQLFRSKIPSIIISILFPIGLTMVFMEPVLKGFMKYTLSGAFYRFPIHYNASINGMIIGVSLLFILLYLTVSVLLFNHRDI